MAKREQDFGQSGRPEDGRAESFASPIDPVKRATAAQMAGRRIAGAKRTKTPRPASGMSGGSFGSPFGSQSTMSFPPAQGNNMPSSTTNSFPPMGGNPTDKNNSTQGGFNFQAPSVAGYSNPFAGSAEVKENQTPTFNGTPSLFNSAQTPSFSFNFGQQNTTPASNATSSNSMFVQTQASKPSIFGNTVSNTFNTQSSEPVSQPGFSFGNSSFGKSGSETQGNLFGQQQSQTSLSFGANTATATPSKPVFSFGSSAAVSQDKPKFTFGASPAISQDKPKFIFGATQAETPISRQTTTPSPTEDSMHTSPDFQRVTDASKPNLHASTNNGEAPAPAPSFSLFGNVPANSSPNTSLSSLFGSGIAQQPGPPISLVGDSATTPNTDQPVTSIFGNTQASSQVSKDIFGQAKTPEPSSQGASNVSRGVGQQLQTTNQESSLFSNNSSVSPSFAAPIQKPPSTETETTSSGLFSRLSASNFNSTNKAQSDEKSSAPSTFTNAFSPNSPFTGPPAPITSIPTPTVTKQVPDEVSVNKEAADGKEGLPTTSANAGTKPPPKRLEAPAHFTRAQKILLLHYYRFRDLNYVLQTVIDSKPVWSDLTPVMAWYQQEADRINNDSEPDCRFLNGPRSSATLNKLKRAAIASEVSEKPANDAEEMEPQPMAAERPISKAIAPIEPRLATSADQSTNGMSTDSPTTTEAPQASQMTPSTSTSFHMQSSNPSSTKRKAEDAVNGDSAALFGSESKRARGGDNAAVSFLKNVLEKKDSQPTQDLVPTTNGPFGSAKSLSPTPSTSGGTSVFDDPAHKQQTTFSGFGSFTKPQDGSDKENQEATDESDAEEPERDPKSRDGTQDLSRENPKQIENESPFSFAKRPSDSPSPAPGTSANSLFGRISKADSSPKSPAEPNGEVSKPAEEANSPFSSFGSSTGPVNHTYNRDSPLKFGAGVPKPNDSLDPTPAKPLFGFKVTPASPEKSKPTAVNGSVIPKATSPFSGQSSLFGKPGSTTPTASPAKPFSFGSVSSTNKPFSFGDSAPKLGSSLFNLGGQASPLPSSTTSRASTPGLSGGDTSAPESSAAEGDGKSGEEFSNLPQQKSLTDLTDEERENEEILFEESAAKAKLLAKDESGKSAGWDIKGSGPLRILKHKATGAVRALMRAHPGGKIVINARIPKGAPSSQPKPKLALLPFANDENTMTSWYFALGTSEATEDLVKVYNENH